MTDSSLAILGYHSIGPPSPGGWSTWFYVPEETFAAQIECLLDSGRQVLSHDELMQGLDHPDALPERAAVLTFDDGYRSMVTVTLPILRRYGIPGILFVPTDYIGGMNTFEPEGWAPREPICDWDDLAELSAGDVSIQSHGAGHRRWSELSEPEQERDAAQSRELLEGRLGRAVDLFSFPYGDAGNDPELTARILRQAGYGAACRYDGAVSTITSPGRDDRFRLSRLQLGPDTELARLLSD